MPASRRPRVTLGLAATVLALALACGLAPIVAARDIQAQTRLSDWTGTVNLYRGSAFVTQKTGAWCVAASTQFMVNLATGSSDRTRSTQQAIMSYAKSHDTLAVSDGSDPEGWAAALRRYGAGRNYEWRTFTSYGASIEYAVGRIRLTGKPVGLLVWSGRHAWVMHGFRATADPASGGAFGVTSVYVSGPLSGTDPVNVRMTPSALARWYTRYAERDGYMGWVGKYVIVSP